ncbi:MAG: GtrA family protein [Pseudolysinimonas sp.]
MTEAPAGPIRRLLADERTRFLLTGGINTVVGYGLFALVQWTVGHLIGYVASLLIAHLLASLLAFTLYRRYVFRVSGRWFVDFLRFQTVYLLPLAANVVALPLLVAVAGLNVYLAQAMIVIVSTVVSYFGHKYFSFRRKRAVHGRIPLEDAT